MPDAHSSWGHPILFSIILYYSHRLGSVSHDFCFRMVQKLYKISPDDFVAMLLINKYVNSFAVIGQCFLWCYKNEKRFYLRRMHLYLFSLPFFSFYGHYWPGRSTLKGLGFYISHKQQEKKNTLIFSILKNNACLFILLFKNFSIGSSCTFCPLALSDSWIIYTVWL